MAGIIVRGPAAEPDGFACGRFTHWNGLAMQTDNQHRPFIHARAAQLDHFIVGEMPCRETIASDSPGGERECLPCVSYVVQAVPIARSPYFHDSRHTILVKTNTTGAEPSTALVPKPPCPR